MPPRTAQRTNNVPVMEAGESNNNPQVDVDVETVNNMAPNDFSFIFNGKAKTKEEIPPVKTQPQVYKIDEKALIFFTVIFVFLVITVIYFLYKTYIRDTPQQSNIIMRPNFRGREQFEGQYDGQNDIQHRQRRPVRSQPQGPQQKQGQQGQQEQQPAKEQMEHNNDELKEKTKDQRKNSEDQRKNSDNEMENSEDQRKKDASDAENILSALNNLNGNENTKQPSTLELENNVLE